MTDGDDPRRHHVRIADQVRSELLVDRIGLAVRRAGEASRVAMRRLIADGEVDALLDQGVDRRRSVREQTSVLGRVVDVDDGRRVRRGIVELAPRGQWRAVLPPYRVVAGVRRRAVATTA